MARIVDARLKKCPLLEICHTYPKRMKLGTIVPYLNLLTLFESLKTFLKSMVKILMKSTKLATPGLLKIKIFKNKEHDELWTMTSPTKFYHVNQIML